MYSANELAPYVRPSDAIQPYEIAFCAKWMVRKGYALNDRHALNLLYYYNDNYRSQFRSLISRYHAETDYQPQEYTNFRENINAEFSLDAPYGEDAHMYY